MYHNRFTRLHPGLILLLIDQSESMNDCLLNGTPLNVIAAESINNIITEMILKLSCLDQNGVDIVKRSAFVSVIGYGGMQDNEADIITDGWIDELAELPITKSALNPICDMVQVVSPSVHGGETPMASAFCVAKDLVEAWMQTHNTEKDSAPIIINISDGKSTDNIADLKNTVNEIKALSVPDGAPLIFNIHLTAKDNVTRIAYPSDINECPDDESKLLFELSSNACTNLRYVTRILKGGEKLFMSNCLNPCENINVIFIG